MKIETEDIKFEGEYPICECGGTIVPMIKLKRYSTSYYSESLKPELIWKCVKCSKETN